MSIKLEQAARQALEALELCGTDDMAYIKSEKAITALREALAEQAEQEPVAILKSSKANFERQFGKQVFADWIYDDLTYSFENAAPVRTKDLTASEIRDIWNSSDTYDVFCVEFARAVIAADREKNK